MILIPQKISKGFALIIIVLIVIFLLGWFYWADLKVYILGSEYQEVITPTPGTIITQDLKQSVISKLGKLKQYGEWPIIINAENPNRGNPFLPKQ